MIIGKYGGGKTECLRIIAKKKKNDTEAQNTISTLEEFPLQITNSIKKDFEKKKSLLLRNVHCC